MSNNCSSVEKSFKVDGVDVEKRIVYGYAASYNNVDGDNDVMLPGCFAKCLSELKDLSQIKVLWQHKKDVPVGVPIVLREDDKGLYVEAKISKTQAGDELLELMSDGVIDSFSVGFFLYEKGFTFGEGNVRIIKEAFLREFSLVTFPANEKAKVMGIKELSVREIEKVLREAGLSKSQAAAVALRGVPSLREAEVEKADETVRNAYLETFKDLKEVLKWKKKN